jgi:carboxymethylenebutenolidase
MCRKPIAVALVALALWTAEGSAAGAPKSSTQSFKNSAGKKVAVELFEPAGKGPFPAVVLLHDAAGLKVPGPFYRLCCRTLADEGYVTLLVHYFDGTSFEEVEPKDVTPALFRTWMDNVRGAVALARDRLNVDKTRVGLVGFSLGGYLALAVARDKALGITCAVEFFAGLPKEMWLDFKYLPPTLIIHGDQDTVIWVREAYALRGFMEANRLVHEFKVYKGKKHMFKDANPLLDKDVEDARLRTLAFFRMHLKQEVRGKVKKVDAARSTLTLTVFDGSERVIALGKRCKLTGPRGVASANGMRDRRLCPGTEVEVVLGADCQAAQEVKLIHFRKSADKGEKRKAQ